MDTTALTDSQVARMMMALMECDTAWRPTDHLIKVTAGRVKKEQMIRVLFNLHDAGKINYRQGLGWRYVR